jgi:purine-binding chemotaxis protein CheW
MDGEVRCDQAGAALLCRVGTRVYAIAIEHVIETLRPLALEPVAAAPPFVLGLSRLRGAPVPVVDLARLLGTTGRSEAAPAPRFVAIRCGARVAALAVDGVVGVAALPRETTAALPPLLGEATAQVVSAVGTLDESMLLVLKSAHMVPPSVWRTLDAAVALREASP